MKKIYLLLTAVLILLLGLLFSHLRQTGTPLEILVAPHGARLTLDGKGIKSGKIKAKTGPHSLVAKMTGFATQTQKIQVGERSQFVGIILQPNSPGTADWYKNHPDDFAIVQTINNRSFDQTNSQLLEANPLLKKLPHIGPALTYRVDYGLPSDASKTGQPAIYIRFRTEADKQAALQWIKSQGLDPLKLDIVFVQGNF